MSILTRLLCRVCDFPHAFGPFWSCTGADRAVAQIPLDDRFMVGIAFEELLNPEVTLPSQFQRMWHGARRLSPERELLLAVLFQAVQDMRTYKAARRPSDQKVYRDAWRWLVSNDCSSVSSFLNICDALGLCARSLRRALLMEGE